MVLATPAIAQPYEGRYRGSSASWRPDYVGTIQMQQEGNINFSATADVELKRVTDMFANSTVQEYEMRGEITITSPVTLKTQDKLYICTAISPVPVRIEHSRMMIYTGDEEYPQNSYELRIFQNIRTPNCVSQNGNRLDNPHASLEVNFDSSGMVLAARSSNSEQPPVITFTPEEQAILKQQQQSAERMFNNPALQKEMQRLNEQFSPTGQPITQADMLAMIERLQQSGVLPDQTQFPRLPPEREAQLQQQFGAGVRRIDYSHLRRFANINQLQDQVSVTHAGQTRTFFWILRRVNDR
jgi:hypothetical protein